MAPEYPHTLKEIRHHIKHGCLIALAGIVGCGKTRVLRHVHSLLSKEKDILVSQSLSVEKNRLNLGTLISALFCDLRRSKNEKIPSQPEQRERELRDLIKNKKKPVVLFVDEAHDLHGKTLIALKRLIEVIQGAGGTLSIVLAGHPKLSNDLKRPTMEEIGARATIFMLEGVQKNKPEYIQWLFKQCFEGKTKTDTIIQPEALNYLADHLSTPLQINQYLGIALAESYRVGIQPITAERITSVLAVDLNSPEAQLIRQGYDIRALAEVLDIKASEVRNFIKGNLPATQRDELMTQLQSQGISL
ncbi:AAA family ATPase [Endozoicomonas sp. 8E]|uniref:AAA family ATPase n=1 Tax=Endozoicomonas sp. 8E TaxID=3035692 RepID=UPI002938ED7B|nr:AAA family ATPase [Endozoicomonas sp. 8E]WOG30332.1 AAA family ATPase [Endozoicomonas sp. 8E]